MRNWALPVSAIIAGTMVAIAIEVTERGYGEPIAAPTGVAVAFWIVAAVYLTVRTFRQSWFETAGRILGSWLIAIGLLYGGASLIPQRQRASPPRLLLPPPSDELKGPGPNTFMPGLDQTRPRSLPGGLDPSRQP